MTNISGDENEQKRQIAIRRRSDFDHPPQEVQNNSRICLNCNRSINTEIDELERDPECLQLNVVKQKRNSSCIFCNQLQNLRKLSVECRISLYYKKYIYARINSLLYPSFSRQWLYTAGSIRGFTVC